MSDCIHPEPKFFKRNLNLLVDDWSIGVVVRVPQFCFQIPMTQYSEEDGWVLGVVILSYISPLSREK